MSEINLLTDISYMMDSIRIVEDIYSFWKPHDYQQAIFNDFLNGKKVIMADCGRKFGKSEMILAMLYYIAIRYPGAACYYICPFAKQAKEIIWESKRIQNFLPDNMQEKYMKKNKLRRFNNSEHRANLLNGSFIKVDGADNFEAYRGINPHIIVYDEFKDHHPEFHKAMDPNLSVFSAPLIIVGTPPGEEIHFYWDMKAECLNPENTSKVYYNFPSWCNPYIPIEWFRAKRAELFRLGKDDEWFLEYEAKFVKSGSKFIYYPLMNDDQKQSSSIILSRIHYKRKDWQFIVTADPAAASCFAVLISAYNKVTNEMLHIDEIYETKQENLTIRRIWEQIIELLSPLVEIEIEIDADGNESYLFGSDVDFVYDEAETWFMNEMIEEFNIAWVPTRKAQNKKESGISLVKDQMVENLFFYSDKCKNLEIEMKTYCKDKNGKIKKVNDHLLDTLRYTNAFVNATTKDSTKQRQNTYDKDRERNRRPEQDINNMANQIDWYQEQDSD
jgi:hypothetical protein